MDSLSFVVPAKRDCLFKSSRLRSFTTQVHILSALEIAGAGYFVDHPQRGRGQGNLAFWPGIVGSGERRMQMRRTRGIDDQCE